MPEAVKRPNTDFDAPDERCNVCGGETYSWVTGYASYRVCKSCGEMKALKPPQPPITIRDIAKNDADGTEDALNELTKLQYSDDEDERINGFLGG